MQAEFDIDEILKKTASENPEVYQRFVPDFSGYRTNIRKELKRRRAKKRLTYSIRIVAATVVLFLVINSVLFFVDFAPAKAYRYELRRIVLNLFSDDIGLDDEAELVKSSTEIGKIQSMVPYTLPAPGWLPETLAFENAVMTQYESVVMVDISFKGENDYLTLSISNDNTMQTNPSVGEGQYEEITVHGYSVYLSEVKRGDETRIKCFFINMQGLQVYISTSIDRQPLLKFIESLK